jgi:hypothetical protein
MCPLKKQETRELPREFPLYVFLFTVLTYATTVTALAAGGESDAASVSL